VTARPSARVDLYAPGHEGLRALLFDLGAAAARLEVERTDEVDALVTRVERALELLDEHAAYEDSHLMPVLHALAPAFASALADDHRRLDALHEEVAQAAYLLAATVPEDRPPAAAHLCRLLDALVAGHLAHMNREETDANQVLWAVFDDAELLSLGERGAAAVLFGPPTPSRARPARPDS
jgi:hypothetical protein